jgi:DNA-binding CsgD family transcriptional regulator
MLESIHLPGPTLAPRWPVSGILEPLIDATSRGEPLGESLGEVVRKLGFDHYTYGTGSVPTPTGESHSYVWTNLPKEWIDRYDECAYIEVDPRVTAAIGHALPMPWDRYSFPQTTRLRQFFDEAARYGICSGVAVGLRNPTRALSGFYLSSPRPRLDDAALGRYAELQGDIMLLAHYVHGALSQRVVDRRLPSPLAGRKLSARELECLQFAAKGLSSKQIGQSLDIGERTVHFHLGNVLSKLGASNRQQAIAKAVAAQLIQA